MRTLAVTGVFSPLGRHIAQVASSFGVRVLGIDLKPMTRTFPGIEFIEADLRNPLIAELFKAEKVDAIVHCAFRWRQRRTEEVFDSNVLGTMRLLGAAALAGVQKVILPSSTVVYGANPENPAFLHEDSDFQGAPAYAYVRELREIETFVNGFRRQQPDMVITTLRFANILGGGMSSPLALLLSLPAAPILLGFDPLVQVIHHDDVVRALGQCIITDHNGVFNVAAPGPLPLVKLLALAGVPPTPLIHPFAYYGFRMGRLISSKAYEMAPLPWDYLRYPWVADTRRMENEMGFVPAIDAETTVRQFGEAVRKHRYASNQAYRFAVNRVNGLTTVSRMTYGTARQVGRRTQAAFDSLTTPLTEE